MKSKIVSIIIVISLLFGLAITAGADDKTYYILGEYSIHYTTYSHQGDFKGRIAFLHGFLYSGSTWENMMPYFTENGYDCYCLDLPSFGYSTRECSVTEHLDREELVTEFCSSIAPLEEWIIAGHSMGGGVALNIATENQVKALLLYAPQKITNGSDSLNSIMKSKFCISMCKFGLKLCTDFPFLTKLAVYFASSDWEYAKNYDTAKLIDPLNIDGTVESICSLFEDVTATDLTKISNISAPILVVWANGDKVLQEADMAELTSALKNPTVKYLDGNHIFIENHAETAANYGLNFLEEIL